MNIITDTDPSAVNGSGASQYKPANTIDALVTRLRLVARMQRTSRRKILATINGTRLT